MVSLTFKLSFPFKHLSFDLLLICGVLEGIQFLLLFNEFLLVLVEQCLLFHPEVMHKFAIEILD
jgi:hypothetical protein